MDSEGNDIMALLAKVIAEGKASPIQFVLDSVWSDLLHNLYSNIVKHISIHYPLYLSYKCSLRLRQ